MSGCRAGLFAAAALVWLTAVGQVFAGEVEIVNATAREHGDSWTVSVTLRHADEGWDHYANRWQVFDPAGHLLGSRVLVHPHVDEQPFTRSLGGIVIPSDVSRVTITASDTVHGVSSQTFDLELSR